MNSSTTAELPKNVLRKIYRALLNNDSETAKSAVSDKSEFADPLDCMALTGVLGVQCIDGSPLIYRQIFDGEKALLKVKCLYTDEFKYLVFVFENDSWKLFPEMEVEIIRNVFTETADRLITIFSGFFEKRRIAKIESS